MSQSTQSSHSLDVGSVSRAALVVVGDASLLAAAGAFLGVALLAVAAAGLVVAGEAAHSQLRLVTASVDALTDTPSDVCTSRPLCVNPLQQHAPDQRTC